MDETAKDVVGKRVRWAGDGASSCDNLEPDDGADHAPVGSPGDSPGLTPSSSGESGVGVHARSSVQDAIEAAQCLAAQVPLPNDESETEDEGVRRYPWRNRLPFEAYGREGGQAASAAADRTSGGGGKGPSVAQLPPPPKDVEESKGRYDWPQWKDALHVEEDFMRKNRVWRRNNLPCSGKALKTKVIFEYKFKAFGELDRYKARLVGCRCRQRPGRDYNETWSPVPGAATTLVILAVAAARGWHFHHVNIKMAYLNVPMDVDAYIFIPGGFTDAGEIGLLLKAIYGVKQAGRLWGIFLKSVILDERGKQTDADACVLTFGIGDTLVVVEIHVDDILFVGPILEVVLGVNARISKHF